MKTTPDIGHRTSNLLLIACIACLGLSACASFRTWWADHKTQVGQTAMLAAGDVVKAASVAAWGAFLESKNPAATQDWNQYFQQQLWQNAPNILTYSTFQKYADVWKLQSSGKLAPVVDAFDAAWKKANPKTEKEAQQFCIDFANGVYDATTLIGTAYK